MWPFKKKVSNAGENAGFNDTFDGVRYTMTHERKQQPDPGAQAYAWLTYALPAFTPIGAGNVALSMRPMPLPPAPLMSQQGAIVRGIPTTAGQVFGQPLLNPLTGGQV